MKRFLALPILLFLMAGVVCPAATSFAATPLVTRNARVESLPDGQYPYLFRQIDSDEGLPDNNVRNMLMLPNGLMYIQTATMLNLYDGAACQSYAFNPIRIPYQEYSGLNYLFYDRDNTLWLSNRDQAWRFDLGRREFEYDSRRMLAPFDIGDRTVESFFRMPDGDFWLVARDGSLWHCDRTAGKARMVDRPEALKLPLIIVGRERSAWMLSLDGTLACYDESLQTFTDLYRGIVPASSPLSSRMEMVAASNGDL